MKGQKKLRNDRCITNFGRSGHVCRFGNLSSRPATPPKCRSESRDWIHVSAVVSSRALPAALALGLPVRAMRGLAPSSILRIRFLIVAARSSLPLLRQLGPRCRSGGSLPYSAVSPGALWAGREVGQSVPSRLRCAILDAARAIRPAFDRVKLPASIGYRAYGSSAVRGPSAPGGPWAIHPAESSGRQFPVAHGPSVLGDTGLKS